MSGGVANDQYLNKKAAVAAAIVVITAIAGAIAAYSSNVLSPKNYQPENQNTTTAVQSVPEEENKKKQQTTTTSNGSLTIPTRPPTTTLANNTVIANNTIIINKPVYENNTVIYQPVNININDYSTQIKQTLKISDNDKVVINNQGDIIIKNNKKVVLPAPNQKSPGGSSATGTYTLTIKAARLPSDGWSGKFTDDRAGMFVTVYDLKGKQIKSGFADENGLKVTGLKNRLYFVYPADCDSCRGSKNDIVFQNWEDRTKDRPRLVPYDSVITASYKLVVPKQQPPVQPPPRPNNVVTVQTDKGSYTSGDIVRVSGKVKEITTNAGFHNENGTFVKIAFYDADGRRFGFVRASVDGKSHMYQNSQFVIPELGNPYRSGTWKVIVMYDKTMAEDYFNVVEKPSPPPPHPPTLQQQTIPLESIGLSSVMQVDVEGSNLYIFGNNADNDLVLVKSADNGMNFAKPVLIGHHVFTAGRFAVSENNVYVVMADNGSPEGSDGNTTLLFRSSTDGGKTFGKVVTLDTKQYESGDPQIVASGRTVYITWISGGWADEGETGDVLLIKSSNAGNTFGNKIKLDGNSHRPLLAALDNKNSNNLYLAWKNYYPDSDELNGPSAQHLQRSKDGGKTFENVTALTSLGNISALRINGIQSGEDGALYIEGQNLEPSDRTRTFFAKSSDGGDNFAIYHPLTGDVADMLTYVSEVTLAEEGQNLYLVWSQSDSKIMEEGYSQALGNYIYFEKSTDGGKTFSKKITIDQTKDSEYFGNDVKITAADKDVYLAWEKVSEVNLATSIDEGKTFSLSESVPGNRPSTTGTYLQEMFATENNNVFLVWSNDTGTFISNISALLQNVQKDQVVISDVHIQPEVVSVNDTFKIEAAITNNSTNTITFDYSPCSYHLSVTFHGSPDSGAVSKQPTGLACPALALAGSLEPGKSTILTVPPSTEIYNTSKAGDVQGTVSFSYHGVSGNPQNISKSFNFTIHHQQQEVEPQGDDDGDGISNGWEEKGVDMNNDGKIDLDLPSLGSDPNHKDFFLEIDYMEHHKPFDKSISDLVSAFSDSPVSNPDGSKGIRLHVNIDDQIPHENYTSWDKEYPLIKSIYFGTIEERSDPNSESLIRSKLEIYHYAVFGHSGGSWGCQWSQGCKNIYISFGNIADNSTHSSGNEFLQAVALLHELGHNLGLYHGGFEAEKDVDNKPNYLSPMHAMF